MSALTRILRIQRGEGRIVGLVVSMMFVSVAGQTTGESGIGAMFFERVGTDALPVMFLVQAGVCVVTMLVLTGVIGRFERRRTYVALPLLLSVVVLAGRVLVETDAVWVFWALYLTTTVAMLTQAISLWGAAGVVTDTRRAKRLFPLFSAGSILGAVVGGLATRPLANAIGASNLLVVWAVTLLVTTAITIAILRPAPGVRSPRRGRAPSPIGELAAGFRAVRTSPLLVWMSVAAVMFSVLFASLYLPFAEAASARFPGSDELAGFLGVFWASVTAGAFLVSILLTNRLIGRFGAAALVLALPFLYGGAFAILLVTATFSTLVAIRFAVIVWLQGVSSPAWETVTNVTPEERRDQIRAFMNGGPSQVGTAIAGAIAIAGLSKEQLAAIGLIASAVTVFATWRVRRAYPGALIDAIRSGRPRVFDAPVRAPIVIDRDAGAIAAATTALRDHDPRVRRLAIWLVAGSDDPRATLALRDALADDDALVRAEAVRALAETGGPSEDDVGRVAGDPDAGVRLALARTAPPERIPLELERDPDPAVATAAVVRRGDADAHARLRVLLEDPDPDTRLRVATELAAASSPRAAGFAEALVNDPIVPVRATAIRALAGGGADAVADAALAGLADEESAIVDASLDALRGVDARPLHERLEAVVGDRTERAAADERRARGIPTDGEATALLRDTLLARGRRNALVALAAAAVTSEQGAELDVALEILREGDGSQLANALEAVEAAVGASHARALIALWETSPDAATGNGSGGLDELEDDPDPFVRACVAFVRAGGTVTRTDPSMSSVERVLVLRRIPLFAGLEPLELQRAAEIADERTYLDGDEIGREGEAGDELHLIVEGTVRVVRDGVEIARRGTGDVIGEMSLLTRAPRIASLIADGEVRTLRIGHREFGAMIRERPDISLAVMRVLAERLAAASS